MINGVLFAGFRFIEKQKISSNKIVIYVYLNFMCY